VVGQTGLEPV